MPEVFIWVNSMDLLRLKTIVKMEVISRVVRMTAQITARLRIGLAFRLFRERRVTILRLLVLIITGLLHWRRHCLKRCVRLQCG
ncbi:hypothetical protein D3C73_1438050 [compost metagenome]